MSLGYRESAGGSSKRLWRCLGIPIRIGIDGGGLGGQLLVPVGGFPRPKHVHLQLLAVHGGLFS